MKTLLLSCALLLGITMCNTNTGNSQSSSEAYSSANNIDEAASAANAQTGDDLRADRQDDATQMQFGLNSLYLDDNLMNLVSGKKDLKNLLGKYHVQYLRFPGGTPARMFFWDRTDLIPKAMTMYAKDLRDENSDKFDQQADRLASKAKNQSVPTDYYSEFIKFCSANGITPVLQLNTYFTLDKDSLYRIVNDQGKVDEKLWPLITANIDKQVKFTHTLLQNVFWEVGNEDHHIYSAEAYGEIAAKFASEIKKLYPGDKVIIEAASSTSLASWNENVLKTINTLGAIKSIDFIAPHYYRDLDNVISTAADVQKRFNRIIIYDNNQTIDQVLKQYPNISMFYTEFGVFRRVSHSNYNSQLHALLMLDYLMQFNASPGIYGVLRHGFTDPFNAFFFTPDFFSKLRYNVAAENNESNGVFKYIPPEATAGKIFLDENPVKAQTFESKKNYAYTVAKSGTQNIVNIVNYSQNAIDIDINTISNIGSSQLDVSTYVFDDLKKKEWQPKKDTRTVKNGKVTLPAYSYVVIKWNK